MTSPAIVREALEVTQADIDQAAAYLGNPPDMAEPEEAELVQILATHRRSAIAGSVEAVAGCLAAAYAAGRSSVRLKSGNPGMNVWRKNALAALDATPEPIAWRTEYRDVYKGHDTGWRYCYHSTKPSPAPLTSDGCGHRNVTPLYAAPLSGIVVK